MNELWGTVFLTTDWIMSIMAGSFVAASFSVFEAEALPGDNRQSVNHENMGT